MSDTSIAQARALLVEPTTPQRPLDILAAAALAAVAGVLMAGVMVLGPGVRFDETPTVQASLSGN